MLSKKGLFSCLAVSICSLALIFSGVNANADASSDEAATINQMELDWGANFPRVFNASIKADKTLYKPYYLYGSREQYCDVNRQAIPSGHFIQSNNPLKYNMSINSLDIKELPETENVKYTTVGKGSFELQNDSNQVEQMNSPVKTIETTYETQVNKNHNFSFGLDIVSKLPFASNNDTGSFSYNWGGSDTQTKSQTVKIEVPSQPCDVKPHSSYTVSYIIKNGSGTMDYDVNAELSGMASTIQKKSVGETGYYLNYIPYDITNVEQIMTKYSPNPYNKNTNNNYAIKNGKLYYDNSENKLQIKHDYYDQVLIKKTDNSTGKSVTEPAKNVMITQV